MKSELFKLVAKINKAKEVIKKQVALTALNYYKDKFTAGNDNWNGEKWQEPKRKTEGPKKYKSTDKNGRKLKKRSGYLKGFSPRDATRHTLVGKGVLARSIKHKTEINKIVFYSNTVYAKRHNEGLDGMPKRQFLGMEKNLQKKIEKIIQENLDSL
ncbi:MAG: hypothetical protein Fur0027_14430 [Raineya sp.]